MLKELLLNSIYEENTHIKNHNKPFKVFTDITNKNNTYKNIDVCCYKNPSISDESDCNGFDYLKNNLIIQKQTINVDTLLDVLEKYDPYTMYGILVKLPDGELMNIMYFSNILKFLYIIEQNPNLKSVEVQLFEYKDIDNVMRTPSMTKKELESYLRDLIVSGVSTEDLYINSSFIDENINTAGKYINKLREYSINLMGNDELLYLSQKPKDIMNKEIFIPVDKIIGDMLLPYYGALAITGDSNNRLYGRNLSYNFLSGNIDMHSSFDNNTNDIFFIFNNICYNIDEDTLNDYDAFIEWASENLDESYNYDSLYDNSNDYIYRKNCKLLTFNNQYKRVFTDCVCVGSNHTSLEYLDRLTTLNANSTYYPNYLKENFFNEATLHQKFTQKILRKARIKIKEEKDKLAVNDINDNDISKTS